MNLFTTLDITQLLSLISRPGLPIALTITELHNVDAAAYNSVLQQDAEDSSALIKVHITGIG